MLIAYIVNHREVGQAQALARWIEELGGVKRHDALLCLTRAANRFGAEAKLRPLLEKSFKTVTTYIPHDEVEVPWRNPHNDASSPNHFFKRVSQHTEWVLKRPFFWFEMDCVPLKANWADALEDEYANCGKPFMGVKLEMPQVTYMSGVAIYPAMITTLSSLIRNSGKAPFDTYSAVEVVPKAHFTNLIQYSNPVPNGGVGDWSVEHEPMREDAVLYHRSRDLSLIDHLRGPKLITKEYFAGMPVTESDHVKTNPTPAFESTTLTEQIRHHCTELKKLAGDKAGRKAMVLTELRRQRLAPRAMHRV